METDIDNLLKQAKEGKKESLESLIKTVQDRIYRLSLKMLYHVSDAEDATQEILLKIITRIDSFRQESSFSTWAMTIAANHLKNILSSEKERWYNFKRCEGIIIQSLPDTTDSSMFSKAEEELLAEELRISCMQGILQCLDKEHRFAYILGVSIGVTSNEGGSILGITPSAFRKRLSRSRERVRDFLKKNCDFFDKGNKCNCKRQSIHALKNNRIDLKNPEFADGKLSKDRIENVRSALKNLDEVAREAALMKINQDFKAPESFISEIRNILESRIN